MSGERVLAALGPVVDAFARLGVDYHIGGSVATSTFGEARSTLDVDVVAPIREEHASPLAAALRGDYYADEERIRDAVRHRSSFNVIYLPQYFKIDAFAGKDTPYAKASFARHQSARLVGAGSEREFRFTTPEDVVLQSLDWYRQDGEGSERQWSDVLGVIRVQATRLDRNYMQEWATKIGVDDLLAQVFAAAGA